MRGYGISVNNAPSPGCFAADLPPAGRGEERPVKVESETFLRLPHAAGALAAAAAMMPKAMAGFMLSTIAVGIRMVPPRSLVVS